MTVLTFVTDFGTRDPYVAQMKGVALSLAPGVTLLDLSHEIPPQDVLAGALFLEAAVPRFPPGTVHVCVIDPGVGGDRRPMALSVAGQTLVAPDNGVLEPFLDAPDARAVNLDRRDLWLPQTSSTFHGRDVFTPVGAHLALGRALEEVGSPLTDPVRLDVAAPLVRDGEVHGVVLHVDHFGNLITNVSADALAAIGASRYQLTLASTTLEGPARSYDAVGAGELLTLIGSSRRLEVSVCCGRADAALDIGRGAPVLVRRAPQP